MDFNEAQYHTLSQVVHVHLICHATLNATVTMGLLLKDYLHMNECNRESLALMRQGNTHVLVSKR